MADTIQSVKWMLEQTCPLRKADEWFNPLLHRAQTYGSHAVRDEARSALHDGICITVQRYTGQSQLLPIGGFDVAQTFAPLGGEGLQQMCAACPAHAAQIAVAGCNGSFYLFPGSSELNEMLRAIVADLGLETAISEQFLETRLLWFGLWTESPLSRDALEVLRPLLSELVVRLDSKQQSEDLNNFVLAIDAALQHDLTLNVEMFPPGHTDFGWHSIFAHCPRCKVGTPLDPWKKTRSQRLTCGICDLEFDPATTAKRERFPSASSENPSLLKMLGEARYRSFAVSYMMREGARRQEANQAVQDFLTPDPEIEKRRQLIREKGKRKQQWIRSVLLQELGQLREAGDREAALIWSFWFSTAEMEILLQRCRQWNVEVSSIHHESENEHWDELRATSAEFGTIEAAFTDLLAQGCDERFSIGTFKVPDELTER